MIYNIRLRADIFFEFFFQIDILSKVLDEIGTFCIFMECIRRRLSKRITVIVTLVLFANSTSGRNYEVGTRKNTAHMLKSRYKSSCYYEFNIYADGKLVYSSGNFLNLNDQNKSFRYFIET